VHLGRVAVAHLVPVVGGQLHLRCAGQTELARGDEVVEAGVGPAFEGEEGEDLVPPGAAGEPSVDVRQAVARRQGAERVEGALLTQCPVRAGRQVELLELVEPGPLAPHLDRGHGRMVLVAGRCTDTFQRSGVQGVDGEQGGVPVAFIGRFGVGERVERVGVVGGESRGERVGQRGQRLGCGGCHASLVPRSSRSDAGPAGPT
jgi:hypothetical protein